MWSLLALDSLTDPLSAEQVEDRALAWLAESIEGVSSEWLAMLFLVDSRYRGGAEAETLLARLKSEQRPDGGWSWLLSDRPGGGADPSNAYSTGVALYALRQAGVPRSDPAVVAAADFLFETQRANGTWEVPSLLVSNEPSSRKDYIYEYWGTAWAVLGLAEMLE